MRRSPRPRLARLAACAGIALAGPWACGSQEREAAPPSEPPAATRPAAAPRTPEILPQGLLLALAQFVDEGGKSVPGPARLEFLYRDAGAWKTAVLEDPQSNVFHKAMVYEGAQGPRILTLAGSVAAVKSWQLAGGKLEPTTLWQEDFGGKFSRMRDAEVADLYGDGRAAIAVATHDQGVVAVLRPPATAQRGDFEVVRLDREADTFVHEIEIGDLDGDGELEVYATPSEPNRLDGTPQSGKVVRYRPKRGEGREVVADLGDRHAKEILVADVDGDGRDELYVAVEGAADAKPGTEEIEPVEIRLYRADTPPAEGEQVATLPDRLCRFLTAGDVDGDGRREIVAAAFSSGVWLLRPGVAGAAWQTERIDADSAGFEHAAILTDLDEDGRDELYVASDKHKELRRYVWSGGRAVRETIYRRPDARPIFTWNLMPVPVELIPRG